MKWFKASEWKWLQCHLLPICHDGGVKRLLDTKLLLTICWSQDDLEKAVVEYYIPAVSSNRKWNCFLFRVWRHSHPMWNWMHDMWLLVTIILSLTACWSWYEKWLNFSEKLYWHSIWCRKGLWDYLLEKWLQFTHFLLPTVMLPGYIDGPYHSQTVC